MRKLKTKTIPCLVMLLGGAVTLLITYLYHYQSKDTLKVLFFSLLACYFVGTLVKTALDRIEIPEKTEEITEESTEIEEEISDCTAEEEERTLDEPQERYLGEDVEFSSGDRDDFVLEEEELENVEALEEEKRIDAFDNDSENY